VFCVDTKSPALAIVRPVSQRARTELEALLKKVESHRQRIMELQTELALLKQKIARAGSRAKSDDGSRKGGPPRRYK
jgi:predicted  nucleic acid-binding Zn-ribbon protein